MKVTREGRPFTASYSVVRVLFKASGNGELWLDYGNREAGSPRYDLDLIAAQLLSTEKQKPALAVAEVLKGGLHSRQPTASAQNFVLWGVLGLAVIGWARSDTGGRTWSFKRKGNRKTKGRPEDEPNSAASGWPTRLPERGSRRENAMNKYLTRFILTDITYNGIVTLR